MSTEQSTTDTRAEYIAGLRALADLLEANPHLRLPYDGRGFPMTVLITGDDDQREQLSAWARALPGEKTKHAGGIGGEFMMLTGRLRGLSIQVQANRDEVCERIVIGTREITEDKPDPLLLAEIPVVTVTRTEEIVQWRCTSILGEAVPR